MLESLDLRASIVPLTVPDRNLGNPQLQLGSSEKQVEIPERIEISKVAASARDPSIVPGIQDFGAAQGVADALLEQVWFRGLATRTCDKHRRRIPEASRRSD